MADVGRPSEMTEETVNKLEEIFALDGTVEEACFFANISRTTYYNWVKEHPELLDRFEELRLSPVLKARRAVVDDLKSYQNAMDYLKRKKKLEFGDRLDVTSGDKPLPIINLNNAILPNNSHQQDNSTDKED